jgi:cysteine desulfurase/selenocysteine lyase
MINMTVVENNMIDSEAIRADFPILQEKSHGQPLVYVDNTATTQKPWQVIQAISQYYATTNANVHRGVYDLAERATQVYEAARQTVQHFIHAKKAEEIVFVHGTTEAINLVAHCYGLTHIKAGDEILISQMEHHSNWVPWQNVCEKTGAHLKIIPLNAFGEIDQEAFIKLLNPRVKLLAISHVSNVLGTINPIAAMIQKAHALDIPVLIDGAQGVPHMPIDVQALDCDFYVFSGHKMYAPMGIGVLYAKEKWLEKMPPYQTGGGMIEQVSLAKTTYQKLSAKFEAGTPNVADAVGLSAAIQYMQKIGVAKIAAYEKQLLQIAEQQFNTIEGLQIVGKAREKAAVISFVMRQAHPHDVATILDSEGIAARAGHHCAMPLMTYLGLSATLRISFGIYNTLEEIERVMRALRKVKQIFGL